MNKLSAFLEGKKKFLAATLAIGASVAATTWPQYSVLIDQIRNITLSYLAAETTVDVVRAISPNSP